MYTDHEVARMAPDEQPQAPSILRRIARAIDEHDVDGLTAVFSADVDSRQPVHPDRWFRGSAQVRKNWAALFEAIPDIRAELVAWVSGPDTLWAEWRWDGNRRDGQVHAMRGVTILGANEDRVAWVRFYMEPVMASADQPGIDASIAGLTANPSAAAR